MSYNEPPPPPPGYGAPQPPYVFPSCCSPLGIVAILLSRSAQDEIGRTGQGGAGLAKAGFILGIIALVFMVITIILVATGNFDFTFETG